MTLITIKSKDYELESLSDDLKLVAFDIGKLTDEIEEAQYKVRTLSALRDVLANQFQAEASPSNSSSGNGSDPLTGS